MIKKCATAVLLASALIGCGGGGEDDGARANNATVVVNPVSVTASADVLVPLFNDSVFLRATVKDGSGVPIPNVKVQIFWPDVLDENRNPVGSFPYEPITNAFGYVDFYAVFARGGGAVYTSTVNVFSGSAMGISTIEVICTDADTTDATDCPS